MYDPTFEQTYQEQRETEDDYVRRIWNWAVANPHVPRPTVAGLLLAAGLEAESAEFASWLIVRERADNGHRSAIIELATACAFDASDWAWRNGYGMTEANRIANWVDDAVRAVYEVGMNGHQRDKLDALALESWEFEQEAGFFSYEPAIPLENAAQQAATKHAAAAGLRRGFVK